MSLQRFNGRLYQLLSPKSFLAILRNDKGAIKKTKFIAPKLGSKSLGHIYVEYNYAPNIKKQSAAAD